MKTFLHKYYYYILIVCFAVMSGFTLFMCCDDYIWYFAFSDPKIASYSSPNGRYLTNFIIRYGVQYPWLFSVFYVISFSVMIILMFRLIRSKKISAGISCLSVFILIHFIPSKTYTEVFRWMSGFPNYCFAFIFTLIYILFVFRILFSGYEPRLIHALPLFVLGIAGSLCIEHLAIYNVLFCIFAIAAAFIKRKKFYVQNLFFLAGSIAGLVLMLSHEQYSELANEGDEIGVRNFDFSLVEILTQIYRFVIPNYCKNFVPVHIIIAIAFTVLYCRTEKKSKYSLPCIIICWLFVIFSSFTFMFEDLAVLSGAMKTSAVDLAFTFLYVCALIYNITVYMSGNERIRAFVFFLSTIIMTAPFAVVSPVTARVFFIEYMFWILFAMEVLMFSLHDRIFVSKDILKKITFAMSCGIFILFANMDITNAYYNNVRFRYIKEQFAEGRNAIEMIVLPYQNYSYDDLADDITFEEVLSNKTVAYGEYIMKYYGISYDDYTSKEYRKISVMDYNNLNES